jgi:hypothetical protein
VTTATNTTTDAFALPTQRTPLDKLRARLLGGVYEPRDHEYDALVTPWNLAVPMRPAAVVQARTAEDVVQAVRFAGAHGLTTGVQATGHGAVSSLAGHLLVSTRGLDEITVHPRERWARIGAGMKWSHLVPHVAPHGLAGVSGSITDVGIVGYTTGGGVGPMARTASTPTRLRRSRSSPATASSGGSRRRATRTSSSPCAAARAPPGSSRRWRST